MYPYSLDAKKKWLLRNILCHNKVICWGSPYLLLQDSVGVCFYLFYLVTSHTCNALSACICRFWRICSWSLEGENSPSLAPPNWFSTVFLKSWTSLLFSEINLSNSGFKRASSSWERIMLAQVKQLIIKIKTTLEKYLSMYNFMIHVLHVKDMF